MTLVNWLDETTKGHDYKLSYLSHFTFHTNFYKYIFITFIGLNQLFPGVCYHCGWSNALDEETRKRKQQDYGSVHPTCRLCLPSWKKIAIRNEKKMRK